MVLVVEVLLVASHVVAPKGRIRSDRREHAAHCRRLLDLRAVEPMHDRAGAGAVGQSGQDREEVAEYIALLSPEREVHEAEIEPAVPRPAPHEVIEQAQPPVLGDLPGEWIEQRIEVVTSLVERGDRKSTRLNS